MPNSTAANSSSVWIQCVDDAGLDVRAPCEDEAGHVLSNDGHQCSVRRIEHVGMDQLHICYEQEDVNLPHETKWRLVSAFTEFTLNMTIFYRLLDVLKGYWLRQLFMVFFSQCVPWPGIRVHQETNNHYGLLPHFELNKNSNIISWNKIRLYLQTYRAEHFNQEQQKIFWIISAFFALFVSKVVALVGSDKEISHLPRSALMDTLLLKIAIMQLLTFVIIFNLMYTGVMTTRMQEHGLRHILLLKKSQLNSCRSPMFFSGSKTVSMLAPSAFTVQQLQAWIESSLGISVAQQRLSVHGFHVSSDRVTEQDRSAFGKTREKLIRLRTSDSERFDSGDHEPELAWLQRWFKMNDSLQPVEVLAGLRKSLKLSRQQGEIEDGHPDAERLEWIEHILRSHPQNDEDAAAAQSESSGAADPIIARSSILPQIGDADSARRKKRRSRLHGEGRGASLQAVALVAREIELEKRSGTLTPTRSHRDLSFMPGLGGAGIDDESTHRKYQIMIRDGHDIQVVLKETEPKDARLLEKWLAVQRTNASMRTGPGVLVVQQSVAAPSMPWAPQRHKAAMPLIMEDDGEGEELVRGASASSFAGTPSPRESDAESDADGASVSSMAASRADSVLGDNPSLTWEEWVSIDGCRHMIDSLVDIMEEERLPFPHLNTIEDTRPTIRLPFYVRATLCRFCARVCRLANPRRIASGPVSTDHGTICLGDDRAARRSFDECDGARRPGSDEQRLSSGAASLMHKDFYSSSSAPSDRTRTRHGALGTGASAGGTVRR